MQLPCVMALAADFTTPFLKQALGLRSQRKPAGYWEDEMNLGGCSCRVVGTPPASLLLPRSPCRFMQQLRCGNPH